MSAPDILAKKDTTWEQKAFEMKALYDKVVTESNWLRTQLARLEATLVSVAHGHGGAK